MLDLPKKPIVGWSHLWSPGRPGPGTGTLPGGLTCGIFEVYYESMVYCRDQPVVNWILFLFSRLSWDRRGGSSLFKQCLTLSLSHTHTLTHTHTHTPTQGTCRGTVEVAVSKLKQCVPLSLSHTLSHTHTHTHTHKHVTCGPTRSSPFFCHLVRRYAFTEGTGDM